MTSACAPLLGRENIGVVLIDPFEASLDIARPGVAGLEFVSAGNPRFLRCFALGVAVVRRRMLRVEICDPPVDIGGGSCDFVEKGGSRLLPETQAPLQRRGGAFR